MRMFRAVTGTAGVAAILMTAAGFAGAMSHASPTMPTDHTVQQDCDAELWPLPLNNVVGESLDTIDYDPVLTCLDVAAATAPDGHNVMNDPANQADGWQITSMSPPAGTPVTETQTITLTVARAPQGW
jgi:hypothetical protein